MKDGRNGEVCVLSEEFHGGNLRFCFDSGHESSSDPCNEFNSIDEGYEVSLDEHQRQASRRGPEDMRTLWKVPAIMKMRTSDEVYWCM